MLMLRVEIDEFNARYASILDRGDLNDWPKLFTEDAVYRITSRENFDADLPMGLMFGDSRAMLEDRVYAILNTTVFSPRYVMHYITNIAVHDVSPGGVISADANFLLVENIIDRNPSLLMAGRYLDKFVRLDGRLMLQERQCIYDSLMIQLSTVFPV
jgi:anthranilate 1,2-dioxygenase small subunit